MRYNIEIAARFKFKSVETEANFTATADEAEAEAEEEEDDEEVAAMALSVELNNAKDPMHISKSLFSSRRQPIRAKKSNSGKIILFK